MNKDRYDLAIEYLTKHPDEIYIAWSMPAIHPAGCLFDFATPDGRAIRDDSDVGCLTGIRRGTRTVWNRPDLTEEIRNDSRLPDGCYDIAPVHLPAFAEWQRRLKKEFAQ